MSTPVITEAITVETRGKVPAAHIAYARTRLAAALRFAPSPVLHVRVKLTRLSNPSLERAALVQVNLDLNGRIVRAQVARPTMREAIDEAHDRLRDRLQRAAEHWEAVRGRRGADDDAWRHAGRRVRRPRFFPRPKDERQVVRHKSFSLARTSVDDAAYEMARLDYDFHLFTEAGSGVDSVLYQVPGEVNYRLDQLEPCPDRVALGATPLAITPGHAPRLSTESAIARLEQTGAPFVFFQDETTGRAHVLYHRYDGHYGLITPAD